MYLAIGYCWNYIILSLSDTGRASWECMPYNNDFVWNVSRLNRDMNNSLAAVRLPIRKSGSHNSRGPVGTLK